MGRPTLRSVVLQARATAAAAGAVGVTGTPRRARVVDHRTPGGPSTGRRPTARDMHRITVAASARPVAARPVTARAAGLALLVKLGEHLVGGNPASFVSFPATRVPMAAPGSFELVRTVSHVPRHSPIWRPDTPLLWEVWEHILDEAVVVDPEPTPDEQARLAAAEELLFDDPATGTTSAAYDRYRELVEAYLDAAAAAVDAAATGDGPDEVTTAVELAARRLAVEGRQAEIEAALDTLASFGLSLPTSAWNDARQALELVTNRKLDDVSNVEFPDTTVVPGSLDDAAWTPIDLDRAEVATLSELAEARFPELIESRLFDDAIADGDGESELRVTRVRAEIARLDVVRGDWFDVDLLASRAWRWREPSAPPVSDGGDPASGRLVAITTGIAVLRGVTVDRIRVRTRDHRRTATPPAPPARAPAPATARVTASRGGLRSIVDTVREVARREVAGSGRTVRRPGRPATSRATPPAVPQHRQPEPCVAAFVCELVPASPDPDPRLFPGLPDPETGGPHA